jgi:hypothetical protein
MNAKTMDTLLLFTQVSPQRLFVGFMPVCHSSCSCRMDKGIDWKLDVVRTNVDSSVESQLYLRH